MNTSNVKKYAPKARQAFIEAMSKQAAMYGITPNHIEVAEQKGDLVLIGDRPFPASVIKPRDRLVKRIEQQGFDQVMEHVAYSWFNRLCAIRYMELKGFLDHGRRVLSSAEGSAGVPQILEECLDIELPGLDQAKVRALKLDGTQDEALYRALLLAQCHALHQAMPFLFEAVADESELLLPDNLTKTDSLIRDLVDSVPEEDWCDSETGRGNIEIIGWLYQFYISEKKDQVIGKVVKSEDIPAATQLFTPNWIVQYLVQNSVGRQWLQTYPDSPLKEKMPYYIEPAEQTPEVQAQLAEMTPAEIAPESIKVLDPAVGSGHILVEAYRVLKAIYEERGYRARDIPQLILENNLFGLDIDDRAGQLAGFSLMMLAREDDRRIFSRSAAAGGQLRLNVLSLQESINIDLPSLWQSLNLTGDWQKGTSQGLFEDAQKDLSAFSADNRYPLLQRTLERFKQAKTFGSLIDVPHDDYEALKALFITLCGLERDGDSMQKAAASQLLPHVNQAVLLAQKYDAVVANPPYMGSKGMNADLKAFAKKEYPNSKSDLFAIFMERAFKLLTERGFNAQVNMQSWMFLSSYEQLRNNLLEDHTFVTMAHLGARAFSQISGEVVQTTAWVIGKRHLEHYQPTFYRLIDGNEEEKKSSLFKRQNEYSATAQDDLKKIPGSPIAYWVDNKIIDSFVDGVALGSISEAKRGISTGNNELFIKYWFEVDIRKIGFELAREEAIHSTYKWFPHNKGGEGRKWYGNNELVVNWECNGFNVKSQTPKPSGDRGWRNTNEEFCFMDGITWGGLTTGELCFRWSDYGAMFDTNKGPMMFPNKNEKTILGFLNSRLALEYVRLLNPTISFQNADINRLPVFPELLHTLEEKISDEVENVIGISKKDWLSFEENWQFRSFPLCSHESNKLIESYSSLKKERKDMVQRMLEKQFKISSAFCGFFGIEPEAQINEDAHLISNPSYRYKGSHPLENLEGRHRSDATCELVSYSVGCTTGRYSLDREGLVYAHAGNQGFAELVTEGAYQTFPADDDGIIPLTDQEWFPDDATNRFREFVKIVWGEEHLQENLDFVAESLCLHAIKPKKSESSMDTIRRYLSTQFYKDHLKTYKKRPIYWLFSSGKQKAFECLVYLHRYNEGTLARMRTEYVIPLTAKMAAYAQKLENDKEASDSAAEVKRLEKEMNRLHKQQAELSEFDEKLRHYADQRIALELDDGVKVNYGKFGDLLAEVKSITGKKPEALA